MNDRTAAGPASARRGLWIGLVLAGVGAVSFSAKAVIVKLAYRHGVDAVTLIMLRMLVALPLFLAMVWWSGRARPGRPAPAPLSRRDVLGVAGLGFCGYYLSSYLDFLGLQYVSASLERLIQYLTPTFVMLLGWLLFGRAITVRQWAGTAIGYAGMLLVFGHEVRFEGGSPFLGAALVLLSSLSYAVYLVYSGELVKRLGSLRLVGLATSVACLCCIVQFLLLRPLRAAVDVAPEVLWLSLVNGTLCTALPVLLLMMAIERIGPALAAQTSMVGPLSTLALGIVVLGEPFTTWLAGGTALVLAGIFVLTRPTR